MTTARDVTPQEMAAYRAAARRRWEREQQELAGRKARAWEAARWAAALLKDQFGATRVVVFGSLVHDNCFTRWSDVDVAAWGLGPEDTLRAIGAVLALEDGLEINLVDIQACRPRLRVTIEREGIDL